MSIVYSNGKKSTLFFTYFCLFFGTKKQIFEKEDIFAEQKSGIYFARTLRSRLAEWSEKLKMTKGGILGFLARRRFNQSVSSWARLQNRRHRRTSVRQSNGKLCHEAPLHSLSDAGSDDRSGELLSRWNSEDPSRIIKGFSKSFEYSHIWAPMEPNMFALWAGVEKKAYTKVRTMYKEIKLGRFT